MSRSNLASPKAPPSSPYVFAVFSLATFMALFVIWRSPGITYRVQAELVPADTDAQADVLPAEIDALAGILLSHDFILNALRDAELVRGAVTPEMDAIVQQIRQRLHVQQRASDDGLLMVQLTMATQNPDEAQQVLDAMTWQVVAAESDPKWVSQPAVVAFQQGGSVTSGQLAILLMLSSVMGFIGVWLADQGRASPILSSDQEVTEAVGLPVVALLEDQDRPANPVAARRRLSHLLLTTAECGLAAVFMLIIFHCVTQATFAARFCLDPLAAYGEALTRIVG